MKKIKHLIKKLFRSEYRLTTYTKGIACNYYAASKQMVLKIAHSDRSIDYWTLYKKGPLGIPEHFIVGGDNTI